MYHNSDGAPLASYLGEHYALKWDGILACVFMYISILLMKAGFKSYRETLDLALRLIIQKSRRAHLVLLSLDCRTYITILTAYHMPHSDKESENPAKGGGSVY